MFQPQAGVLRPELCTSAHIELARAAGADVHENESVRSVNTDKCSIALLSITAAYAIGCLFRNGLVNVLTDRGAYQSKKVVLRFAHLINHSNAAVVRSLGAWLPQLLKSLPSVSTLAAMLKIERQVVSWYRPKEPALFELGCVSFLFLGPHFFPLARLLLQAISDFLAVAQEPPFLRVSFRR